MNGILEIPRFAASSPKAAAGLKSPAPGGRPALPAALRLAVVAACLGATMSAWAQSGPQFNVSNPSPIPYGTTSLALNGVVYTSPLGDGAFPNPGETVTATINGYTVSGATTDSSGDFSINFNDPSLATDATGFYSITYNYNGTIGSGNDSTTSVQIDADNSTIFSGLSNPTLTYGTTSVTLTGTVFDPTDSAYPAQGETVTASINGQTVAGQVTDNTGDFSITFNDPSLATDSVGPYTITYSYAGDGNIGSANDTSATLSIGEDTLTSFENLGSASVPYGSPSVTLTGTVADFADGIYPANGETVTALINGATVAGAVYDDSGDFSITFNDPSLATDTAGNYSITYSYGGDGNLGPANDSSAVLTVTGDNATLFANLTSPVINYGTASVSLSGVVADPYDAVYPAQGETVTAMINGQTVAGQVTDNTGDFLIVYNDPSLATDTPGAYIIAYSYAGNGSVGSAADSSTALNISEDGSGMFGGLPNPMITYGTSGVTLSGKVGDFADSLYPAPGDTVTATINGVTVSGTVGDSSGDFSINFADPSLAALNAGNYTVTYNYISSGVFDSFTDTSTALTVMPDNNITFQGLSDQSTTYGPNNVNFSGSVGDFINNVFPQNGEFVSASYTGGSASGNIVDDFGDFALSGSVGADAGTYTVTYSYGGDGNLGPANDSSTTVQVTRDTSTSFTYQTTPSMTYGSSSVLLTGAVGDFNYSICPSLGELVTASINGVTVAGATTDYGGDFAVDYNDPSLATLPVGTYGITFNYNGDNDLGGANDSSDYLQVNPDTTIIFTGITGQTINYGGSSVTVSGIVGDPADNVYPSSGEGISVTIDGVTISGTVSDNKGDFSLTDNDPSVAALNAGDYPIQYAYGGDANLGTATDASTVLHVQQDLNVTFANLTNQTVGYGASSVTLNGTVGDFGHGGYPQPADPVFATINGHSVMGFVIDTAGDFTVDFNDPSLATNLPGSYPVTYSYTGGGNLASATDDSTTLTITPPPAAFLGTTNLVEGPASGNDSVILAASPSLGTWTAAANDAWLHINPANAAGTGGTNVLFSFDTNTGATRTGTLTIDGLTVTVTQAGSTYAPVTALTTLAGTAQGLLGPVSVGVDGAGDVDIADQDNAALYQLPVGASALLTLPAAGLNDPTSVAVDINGDVFVTDATNMLWEFPLHGERLVTVAPLVSVHPISVALDGAGNLYIADMVNDLVSELPHGGRALIPLAGLSSGLSSPSAVAVDAAGNVYIADTGNDGVYELPNGGSTLITLANSLSGMINPSSLAVDGSGNLYIADSGNQSVFELPAGGSSLLTLANGASGLVNPTGVALDGAANLYIADLGAQKVFELPHAFVDATPRTEYQMAGSDSLPAVLPVTANLSGPLAPHSSQPWLTINNTNGGVLNFTYPANNSGSSRTADLTLLGDIIPVTQGITEPPPVAATMNVLRPRGLTVKISLSDLATNWTDAYDLPVTLTAIDLTSTNGRTVYPLNLTLTGGAYVISPTALLGYVNPSNVDDQISYTISDSLGDTAAGLINIIVSTSPMFGQTTAVVPNGGSATVNFAGQPGYSYTIQRSTNLVTGSGWVSLETTNAPPAGPFSLVDSFSDLGGIPPGSAYYRLSWNP